MKGIGERIDDKLWIASLACQAGAVSIMMFQGGIGWWAGLLGFFGLLLSIAGGITSKKGRDAWKIKNGERARRLEALIEKYGGLARDTEDFLEGESDIVRAATGQIEQIVGSASEKLIGASGMQAALHQAQSLAALARELSESDETMKIRGFLEVSETLISTVEYLLTRLRASGLATHTMIGQLDEHVAEMLQAFERRNAMAKEVFLLSLNARIEASRAGDGGQGFSVVADRIQDVNLETQGIFAQIAMATDTIRQTLMKIHGASAEIANIDLSDIDVSQQKMLEAKREVEKIAHERDIAVAQLVQSADSTIHTIGGMTHAAQAADFVQQLVTFVNGRSQIALEVASIAINGINNPEKDGIRRFGQITGSLDDALGKAREDLKQIRNPVQQSSIEEGNVELF